MNTAQIWAFVSGIAFGVLLGIFLFVVGEYHLCQHVVVEG